MPKVLGYFIPVVVKRNLFQRNLQEGGRKYESWCGISTSLLTKSHPLLLPLPLPPSLLSKSWEFLKLRIWKPQRTSSNSRDLALLEEVVEGKIWSATKTGSLTAILLTYKLNRKCWLNQFFCRTNSHLCLPEEYNKFDLPYKTEVHNVFLEWYLIWSGCFQIWSRYCLRRTGKKSNFDESLSHFKPLDLYFKTLKPRERH